MRKLLYILIAVVCIACTPSLPSGILSEGEMTDILYDMHIAQTMYESGNENKTDEDIISLRASVLDKYDVSQAEWDSSFIYYCRNTDKLHHIYLTLSERIQNNVIALGGKVDGIQGEEADTSNVWNNESSFILMQQAPYNRLSYAITPDSTFEDGDRITLQFDVQFIFQDGYRDVVAFMAVYYDNDSINTGITHVSGDGHGIITLNNDVDRLHIKQIRGYFILGQNLSREATDSYTSTLRLATVRNVKLLHTHTIPPAKKEENKQVNDSLLVDSLRKDSLIKNKIPVQKETVSKR